jgi:thiamine biosynthesis lipoprotein ApbE
MFFVFVLRRRKFKIQKTDKIMHSFSLPLAALSAFVPNQSGVLAAHFEHILGTSLDVKILANSFELAEKAEAKVLAEFRRLQAILGSGENHEFGQWTRSQGEMIAVSDELHAVLGLFDTWREATRGALNAAADDVRLNGFSDRVNQAHWELGEGTATRLSDAELRLHTFTKGFIMEQVADAVMAEAGVRGVMLNVGGDMLAKGDLREAVRVSDPYSDAENGSSLSTVSIQNQAIATSGVSRRGAHIIDPRTGETASGSISATVIHPDAVTAGALATAFNVLSVEESKALAAEYPETEYLLVDAAGTQHVSNNWSGRSVSTESAIELVHVKDKAWTAGQELLINVELANLGGGARRPYVAVWIEDEQHKAVRRLALWYRKPRWLPDLRSFYDAQREVPIDLMSIASATRSAGNYSLIWDGKNDQGEYVALGNYTVYIEAAREHGSYQLMKQTMKFDGKAKSQALAGNEEISGANLVYKTK